MSVNPIHGEYLRKTRRLRIFWFRNRLEVVVYFASALLKA